MKWLWLSLVMSCAPAGMQTCVSCDAGSAANSDGGAVEMRLDAGVDAGVDAGPPTGPRFFGRTLETDAGTWLSWPGSGAVARFTGANLTVLLDDKMGPDPSYHTHFDVQLDGQPPTLLVCDAGLSTYLLAAGLDGGAHTVVLFKRTEAVVGETRIAGFELEDGGAWLPAPAAEARQLEFVGDSITCGYGNEGPDQNCGFSATTENHARAYPTLTARSLDAGHRAIAYSARGLYRNLVDTLGATMPELYQRTLAKDPNPQWDFTRWAPAAVIINLGTNDFGRGIPDEAPYLAAYRSFVDSIRGHYPNAHIYCAVGPMHNDSELPRLTTMRRYHQAVVDGYRAAGDLKVHFIEFPAQVETVDGLGCDWHPSLAKHRQMAEQLSAALKADLGW